MRTSPNAGGYFPKMVECGREQALRLSDANASFFVAQKKNTENGGKKRHNNDR